MHSRVLFVFNLLFAISRVPDNEELESYKPLQPKVKVGTKEQKLKGFIGASLTSNLSGEETEGEAAERYTLRQLWFLVPLE